MNRKPSEKDNEELNSSGNNEGNGNGAKFTNMNIQNQINNGNPMNIYAPPQQMYMIPPGYNPYYPW